MGFKKKSNNVNLKYYMVILLKLNGFLDGLGFRYYLLIFGVNLCI